MKQPRVAAGKVGPGFDHVRDLLSIAVAIMDGDGKLIKANRGLCRLVDAPDPATGFELAPFFAQPRFEEIVSSSPGQHDATLYAGIFNIGSGQSGLRSLVGKLWRADGNLLLVAEQPIEDLEQMSDTAARLNDKLADAQRQLVRSNSTLRGRERELEQIALTDALTGLPNRRHLEQVLTMELSRSNRRGIVFSVALADIDNFKQVNDEHGHEVGDAVLEVFAQLLQDGLRAEDFAARQGGEEFLLVLPNTSLEGAAIVTERVRKRIEDTSVEALGHPVTASFGVAQWSTGEEIEALLRRADQALYHAKQNGRNRVEITAPPDTAKRTPADGGE